MSLINFPGLIDTFPAINAAGGDNLNTTGKEHDGQHNKTTQAVVALEKILVGPTFYNVAGYPQSTFDLRFAAALADAHSGGGTVVVTPGAYSSTGLGTITKPTVSVWGPGGPIATVITRTGGTTLLTFAPSPLGTDQMGELRGIKLKGDSTSGLVGVKCIDCGVLPAFRDTVIADFNGTGAIGLSLENTTIWNERGSCDRLSLEHNTIGLRFNSSGSNNSFFYHRWADLRLNIGANQIGVQTIGTALLQGSKMNLLANIDGDNGIVWDVNGSSVVGGEVFASGEQTSGTGGIARKFNGGTWAASGSFSINGAPDSGGFSNLWSPSEVGAVGHQLNLFPAVPTIAVGAAAGTSPPSPAVSGNDIRGIAAGGTGSATTTGTFLTVTFNQPYPVAPIVTITPFTAQSALYRPYIAALTTTSFSIGFNDAPATGLAAGTLAFTFQVSG